MFSKHRGPLTNFWWRTCMPCQKYDSNMILMNFQSKKYATQAPAWTSIDCLLLPGNYNLLPVLTNNFLMNQLLLEKRRCWGKKWIERRHSKKDAVGKGLAFFFFGINMMYSRMCSNRCKGNQMHTTNMTTHVPIYKVRACVHDSDHMISACRTNSLPLYIIIVFGTLTQKKTHTQLHRHPGYTYHPPS